MRKIFLVFTFLLIQSISIFAYQTDTQYIPSDKYFDTALTEITNSKSSITMAMYLISSLPDQPDSQPNQLLNALVKAKDRGITVKVILDQNINFGSESLDEAVEDNKNQKAYELLKKNNIPVFFDTSDTYTHAKVLVIDDETVLLGSTNWSKAALTRNNEANVLIRSKDFAKEVSDSINKIQIQENVPAILTPSVQIPEEFIESKNLLGEIATHSDERALDTYLYFLKEFDQNAEGKLTLDYDNLAKSLNIDKMSTEDYRRQINKVLFKLKDKYKLITFESSKRNQNAELSLIKPKEEAYTQIPTTYWKYNWSQNLPFQGKVLYLILLNYSESSPSGKISVSREQMSRDHGISESFVSDGTKVLRKLNLLNIQYSELENQKFDQRQSNTYTLKALYDFDENNKQLKSIQEKYKYDRFKKASDIAAIVFEENNPKTIQTLLNLEEAYGEAIVREAAKKISEKNPDNPKRSAGYLINTIKIWVKTRFNWLHVPFIFFLVFICFFSWILPLGAFIKPSQEGTACGGKRAFHMCTMEIRKIRPAETSPKISFTNTSGYGHQGKSSAGGSEDDFVVASRDGRLKDNNFRHFGFSPSLAYSYFPDSIEPPPKTFPFSNLKLKK